jgi:hypothetical protein
MVPWPTPYAETSFVQPPIMISPTQQSPDNQDPFASHNNVQCMPLVNQASNQQCPMQMYVQQQQQQQQQPPSQQPMQLQYDVDPWVALTAGAPAAPPQQQMTPPPSMVVYDCSNQVGTSPIGDISVMAVPVNTAANSSHPVVAATNPFDFCHVASSMPIVPPPSNMPPPPDVPPPPAPPTPPKESAYHGAENQQFMTQQHQVYHFANLNGHVVSPNPEQTMASPPLSPSQAFSPASQQGYGYVSPTLQQTASPPMSPIPAFSSTSHSGVVDPFGYASSPTQQQMAGPPSNLLPQYSFAPQQAYEDPFGYAFSPMTSPITSPNGSPGAGALVPSTAINADPFGIAGNASAGLLPFMPGTQDPTTTRALVPSAAAVDADPFGVFGDQAPHAAPTETSSSALVTSGVIDSDPFGLFGAPTPTAIVQQMPPPAISVEGDLLGGAGFAPSQPPTRLEQTNSATSLNTNINQQDEKPINLDSNNLPSDGEYYEVRITARTLGAMFYSARNLENSLLYKMPNNVLEALGSRPVVVRIKDEMVSAFYLHHQLNFDFFFSGLRCPKFCCADCRCPPWTCCALRKRPRRCRSRVLWKNDTQYVASHSPSVLCPP